MVYVNAKLSDLNKYIGKNLLVEEIEETLIDMGMDVKGNSGGADPELKIEITAEKLDMVSIVGIARAIKYYRGLQKGVPKYKISKGKNIIEVKKSAKECRPKTVAAILRNVPMTQKFLDEMIEFQEKIHDSFGRGRKKVAIGIYPMDNFEFPLTYDAEDPSRIIFRPLEYASELNGHEILQKHDTGRKYSHLLKDYSKYPVFRDKQGKVLSMPPIINSHDTGKVEANHRDLFVECTGFNLTLLENVMKNMVTSFIEMGVKEVESVKINYEETQETYELNLDNFYDELELNYVNKLIGIEIKEKDVEKLLNKGMYGLRQIKDKKIEVEIPCFRSDVWNDCDIADDMARAYGYNNIEPKTPSISSVGEMLDYSMFRDRITETLVNMGFLETYTYMLTSTESQYKKMTLKIDEKEYVRLQDTADQGLNMIRTRILPESLTTLNINRKNKYPQHIFENGFVIKPDSSAETKAVDCAHLCVSIADTKANYTWIKGVLDSVLTLHNIDFKVKEKEFPFLIPGRSGVVCVGSKEIGFIGEVHPQVLETFGLIVPVVAFEIDLEGLK